MYASAYSHFKPESASEIETQSQKQLQDSKKLFGPHAKLNLQNSPPVLENEDVALRQLRDRLGPYAAEDALLYHLRASRGKLNWAVNTYFRAVLADQTAPTDFQPKHYAQLSSTSNAAFMSSSRPDDVKAPQTLEQIPNAICEHILQYTDLLTVCNARAACRSLKTAASSDMLWQQLYHERWHCNPTSHDMLDVSTAFQPAPVHHSRASQPSTLHQHSSADPATPKSSWLQLYQKRHTAECQMQCPHCRQPKIVPVVYGFPSHLLTLAMRADMLRMGNDHLIDGQPVWTCTNCCVELNDFPFPILSQH